jgi:hypothetical protein
MNLRPAWAIGRSCLKKKKKNLWRRAGNAEQIPGTFTQPAGRASLPVLKPLAALPLVQEGEIQHKSDGFVDPHIFLEGLRGGEYWCTLKAT